MVRPHHSGAKNHCGCHLRHEELAKRLIPIVVNQMCEDHVHTEEEALTVILAMNGYTVRMGKEKRGGKSTLTYFVEYWRADNEG